MVVGASWGTSPPAAEDFCTGGKRINIPFLKTGTAKQSVVLLEPEGNCPGAVLLVEMASFRTKSRASHSVVNIEELGEKV